MTPDLEAMSLTEMIRLRELISEVLLRRFERNLALAFTDVVGSTPYFAEFGDEAGRGLQQRHYDALAQVLPRHDGRIVDTAGDGAFTCFPTSDHAVAALAELMSLVLEQNASRPPQHHLMLRAGVHWGPVLTDGVVVTGDAVNTCARVCSSCAPSEVRLTKAAFLVLSSNPRSRCTPLAPAELKGIARPVEMMAYKWYTQAELPAWVTVRETAERIRLPKKSTISFGRLKEHDGMQANDVVLMPPNPDDQVRISRWQFELRQQLDGMVLAALSDQITEVDGRLVARGQTAPVRPGTEVRLAGGVMTLIFEADARLESSPSGAQRTVMIGAIKIDGEV